MSRGTEVEVLHALTVKEVMLSRGRKAAGRSNKPDCVTRQRDRSLGCLDCRSQCISELDSTSARLVTNLRRPDARNADWEAVCVVP